MGTGHGDPPWDGAAHKDPFSSFNDVESGIEIQQQPCPLCPHPRAPVESSDDPEPPSQGNAGNEQDRTLLSAELLLLRTNATHLGCPKLINPDVKISD